MPVLLLILLLTALGSAVSIVAAALYMLLPEHIRSSAVPRLISFATGTLLGAAFLGLLPKAIGQSEAPDILAACLAGIILFMIIEKLVIWRHCHKPDCAVHTRAASLILLGDAFHNFIDGIAIAAATVLSVPLGISTAIAVVAHEVPQEIGDFAILLAGGYSRRRALFFNLLSSLAAIPGALLAYYVNLPELGLIPVVMALSAASFIYIAVADLIPASHASIGMRNTVTQVALVLAGIAVIVLIIR